MKTPKRNKFHLRGHINGNVVLFIVILCVGSMIFDEIFGGSSSSSSSSSGSSRSSNSSSASSSSNYLSSEEVAKKFCKYSGCISAPSEFWEAGTGYCGKHAQQLRDEQKLIEKMKTQGY